MRFKKITALLSGAAVLMTTVTGGCFSVPAAETEADRLVIAAERISSTETLPVPLTESPAETQSAGQTEDNAEKEAGSDETAATETAPALPEETDPSAEKAAEKEQISETETKPSENQGEGTESLPETEPGKESEEGTEPATGVSESEISSEKVRETEPESELQIETGTEAAFEEETESETEILLDEIPEEESESETEEDYSDGSYYYNGSYWDPSWYFRRDFRFSQVKKQYAIVHGDRSNRIYEQPDQKSAIVGEVPFFGLVCVLKSIGEWSYVESGDVRGFIPSSELESGSDTTEMVDLIGEKGFETATPDIEIADNRAFTYTQTTTKDVLADKDSALVLTKAEVLEYPKENARAVGEVQSGSLVYILAESQEEKDWYFVESGDVRGFIRKSDLFSGGSVASILQDSGKENLATELINPEDNRSLYFSLSSVKPAASSMGEEIAEYAATFVGKIPYVWGGTSLSYGADCSGFVQSIFSSFGINLPRIAQDQGANGEIVPDVSDAQPGDIVYWGSNPHVGIYLGDGKVVHCSGHSYNTAENPGTGPMISNVDFMPITSIRRYIILQDSSEGIAETGFRTDGTEYSQKQMELIWAIVAQEDNGSYQGALAVISSAMNRTESGKWGYEGGNALSQLTAPGQYCYSMDNYWKSRLNGNVPDYVKQAVDDCLRKGIRNHNFTSFRSRKGKTTGANAVQIGGNWFFGA
ncbi:NlpC/P60 family protein [Porcincola intestinalis]|uniref:NlpC/P60 family protein n=1 Tax=Porcincola intestinalis TaxID=2606632 RepID=UPI002A90F781|nr:NlpC/P60 family protein [Porcincola intestinalis]